MVTNCKTEPSFSHMKWIKNSNRTTMRQDGMESTSLLMIAADLFHQINFEDLLIGCCCTSTILWRVQVNFQWEDGEARLHRVESFLVLVHWNNSPRVDISLQSDTLFWFRASAVMLRLSINWKSIKKTCFYFLVQYTRKCINSTHLSNKPIQLCVIYSKWKKIKY